MDNKLERILMRVQKPARYTGGEYNQILKDRQEVEVRVAFCFPDIYDIGMCNQGMNILYQSMNSVDGVWCERVYAPWGDMREEMEKNKIPLYALESGDALTEFDILAFSIGYEMAFTTVLDMIYQAGIPLHTKDRTELKPLVIAGGSACVNAEPMAEFLDLAIIGEGEEVNNELLYLYRKAKRENWSKIEFLQKASGIEGIYVPSLYEVQYGDDGAIRSILPQGGAPQRVRKRIIKDMDAVSYPTAPVVPNTEIVQDKANLELFRGCIRGCRFCQAGYIYRPVRKKSPEKLVELGRELLKNTGYSDCTLLSLSSSDYLELNTVLDGMLEFCEPRNIGISLPSLRADNFSLDIVHRIQKVRKSGLTFAVEGGSQRLRDAINKNVTEEELLNTCRLAFQGGWSSVKLYYMLGLPTETDEDVLGIAEMANKVLHCWREYSINKKRGVRITISTSCFIPKPFSPFQWEAQIPMEEYMRRVQLLSSAIKAKNVTYNWHDADIGFIEAVLSRGDRRLGPVLEEVWKNGGRLEAWEDYFNLERWQQAFEKSGLDPHYYANRCRSPEEILPWSVIDVGVRWEHLWNERQQAYKAEKSLDCRHRCLGCGASELLGKGGKCNA